MEEELKKLMEEYKKCRVDVITRFIGKGKTRLEAEKTLAQMEAISVMPLAIRYCLDKAEDKKEKILIADALMSTLHFLALAMDLPDDDREALKAYIIANTPIPRMLGDLFAFMMTRRSK